MDSTSAEVSDGEEATRSTEARTVVKGHCPRCGPDRKAFVRGRHSVAWAEDDGTAAKDTGMILECCGCETVYFRRDFWFSEWGDPMMYGGTQTTYWPSPVQRDQPKWLVSIERKLRELLGEMYLALDHDLRVLAAIAARTVIDSASELLGVDTAARFGDKLKDLQDRGKISADERGVLQVLVEAGNAAAHRGWRPQVDELSTMIDVVESFLHRSFVVGGGIKKLRKSVPSKPERKA